jgi:putative methyltransferase (TIGR04325 family)
VWGAYARSWVGMERTAEEKMAAVAAAGLAPDAFGADLPNMARAERRRNIWAVRWLYHHLERGGLCLRPPWSMVEHIGFDELATNSVMAQRWANPPLRSVPPIPANWPAAEENPECQVLWRKANPATGLNAKVKTKLRGLSHRVSRHMKQFGRRAMPKPLRTHVRRWFAWQWFRGDYPTWAAARAASGGYEGDEILARVLDATLKVQAGQAAFERDSVVFQEPDPDTPLLMALQEVRRATDSGLRVVDFGGSLGSTYWRARAHLPLDGIQVWDVVEQARFVEAGNTHVRGERLRFFQTVGEANENPHDVIICSTTLQYLERPADVLARWGELDIPFLLLNNVPLHDSGPTRLRVQHVPPSIYPASYPVWFFNRAEFLGWVQPHYDIVQEFASEAVWPVDGGMYPSTGLLLRRKPQP